MLRLILDTDLAAALFEWFEDWQDPTRRHGSLQVPSIRKRDPSQRRAKSGMITTLTVSG